MVPESLPHVEELKTEITCHVDAALLDVSETSSIRRGRFLTVYQNTVLQRLRSAAISRPLTGLQYLVVYLFTPPGYYIDADGRPVRWRLRQNRVQQVTYRMLRRFITSSQADFGHLHEDLTTYGVQETDIACCRPGKP